MFPAMRPAFLEKDAEKQKELYGKFLTDNVAPHLVLIEKVLEKNGSGYLVGQDVSCIKIKMPNDSCFMSK